MKLKEVPFGTCEYFKSSDVNFYYILNLTLNYAFVAFTTPINKLINFKVLTLC